VNRSHRGDARRRGWAAREVVPAAREVVRAARAARKVVRAARSGSFVRFSGGKLHETATSSGGGDGGAMVGRFYEGVTRIGGVCPC